MTDLFAKNAAPAQLAAAGKTRPSLHSDTAIYRTVIDLAKCMTKASADMRRDAKPVLGRYLFDETVWMGVLVLRANKARDAAKLPHLDELLEQTELVTMALRLGRETAFVTNNAYNEAAQLVVSVARQATALRNIFAPAP